ncbi:ABC transporter ATP-binding protein [Cupriavidus agavae]|uniref:Iron complex transport system ATP-binding protein n=1 Tax=Cupriavidus agavae TaxID=1001822 RepID=A0A4Q7RCC2_9BURK|nr:ABC transporter ATP-binding protein [Cupriavidus agavae]RZT30801.1 iron complex transport system ATP-binding protein [Cupriavidus agavae]
MADFALQCHGIGHHYGGRSVLRNLSLALPRGALCALMGANGAGKSTLLKILAGQLAPAAGQVTRRGRMGFVPQEVLPALPIGVLEMVLLGRAGGVSLLRAPGRADYAAARAALARVEAVHLADRAFLSLSGGERQLVVLARALAAEADVLLLDEPCAAMDWHNQAVTLRLLAELAATGITVVFSTHAPQHALEFASHAALLFAGGDHAFGAPDRIMHEAALTRLYRVPVRRVRLDALPHAGTAVPVFSQPTMERD